MNRGKEIVFVLALGFLFIITVQLSLAISEKPSVNQRIPLFKEATFELSAQPVSLVKELLTTELCDLRIQRGHLGSIRVKTLLSITSHALEVAWECQFWKLRE